MSEELYQKLANIEKRLDKLDTQGYPRWRYLATPLTSTSWDGDAHSTTAATLIDLSAVFSAPAGIKAVLMRIACRDSAAWGTADLMIRLGPTSAADAAHCRAFGGDIWTDLTAVVPCDANGDVYYAIAASGAGTLDAYITIYGYYL